MPFEDVANDQTWTYRIIRGSIRYRAWVVGLMVLVALLGAWVAWQTPIDALPDLSDNQVLLYTEWPDHFPEEIERTITRPLAQAMRGIDGVQTVRGSSDVGFSLIHLIYEDRVPFSIARERASQRLQKLQVELPAGVVPKLSPNGIPIGQVFWYSVLCNTTGPEATDLAELRNIQDHQIAPALRQVEGVAEVASVGGFVPELHIDADPNKLQATGWSLADLEAGIRQQLRAIPDQESNRGVEQEPFSKALDRLRALVVSNADGHSHRVDELCRVSLATQTRYGIFEMDGNEVVGGVVHLEYGANPLQVTTRLKDKLRELEELLPAGVRVVPCYDRSPLITGAVWTVLRTLLESLAVTTLGVVWIMRHWRTSLVITITLPLAVLSCFLGLTVLRWFDIASIQTNVMSLAGIAISIGVLVDSSIVVAENVTHRLRELFGERPIEGDVSDHVASACAQVARPACFAMLIMIVSFLPIFAFQGIDGKIYHPLAWTKTLTLASVALLTIACVPALCSYCIRGRLRSESESRIVRSVMHVYRPVLSSLIDNSFPLICFLSLVLILGAVVTGSDFLVSIATVLGIGLLVGLAKKTWSKAAIAIALISVALAGQAWMTPIRLSLRLPLDEGMVMDMPITIPSSHTSQAVDDLKIRDMILCRFPEIQMVAGKVGRAQTAFDPAPLDMIETMVEFQPQEYWPSRRMLRGDAAAHTETLLRLLTQAKMVQGPTDPSKVVQEITDVGLLRLNAIQRELCWQMLQSWQRGLSQTLNIEIARQLNARWQRSIQGVTLRSDVELSSLIANLPKRDQLRFVYRFERNALHSLILQLREEMLRRGWIPNHASAAALEIDEADLLARLRPTHDWMWREFVRQQNDRLYERTANTWTRIVCSELFLRLTLVDEKLADSWDQVFASQTYDRSTETHHGGTHHGLPSYSKLPIVVPYPKFEAIVDRATRDFQKKLWLWPHTMETLTAVSGEMDTAVQVPGWANVWTRPIQNRVDMLTTGIHSEVGIRVLGSNLDEIVALSDKIATLMRDLPGAVDVIADPIRDKAYQEIVVDTDQAEQWGISAESARAWIDRLQHPTYVGNYLEWKQPVAVRLGIDLDDASRRESKSLPAAEHEFTHAATSGTEPRQQRRIGLGDIANVVYRDGPATIKSENGSIRNYVRFNVRGRDPLDVVRDAKKLIEAQISLPTGVRLEWTGQFEHAAATRRTMLLIVPLVVAVIGALLYLTFRDWQEACLMFVPVPLAVAGGAIFQWFLGYPFSIAVLVGYLACVGMAAATSMIMLVYLRHATHAVAATGTHSLSDLRHAVIEGAVHRLRPKLLTEATMVLGLVPMLWSSGPGADVIRPMAAPVLGGILIADEVVDLLIPILYYAIQRRRWSRKAATDVPDTLNLDANQ